MLYVLCGCCCRVRILDELEPGALYSLWKASMGQYVLDDTRKAKCFESYIIWDDFPTQPGQVRPVPPGTGCGG
jgi:hypothetical protein